jgi:hypothetical protein
MQPPNALTATTDPWASNEYTKWPDPADMNDIAASDCQAIEAVAAQVHPLIAKARAAQKPVLLHLGVGVGNPDATLIDLNNPSVGVSSSLSRWQVTPTYLMDAVAYKFYVVALNFNNPDPACPIAALDPDHGVHLPVLARFPLGSPTAPNAARARTALDSLAASADRIVVLNSVSQLCYTGLKAFCLKNKTNAYPRIAYVSYYEKEQITVLLPAPVQMPCHHERPDQMGSLFPGLERPAGS